ncbi:family 43 glycosylhydrolase [Gynuella sp.]|uniref:family 43 glycosylhydrolase n=1 Tax=Gynuella sp. TaxID=2969146 RepID=UPI003D1118EB
MRHSNPKNTNKYVAALAAALVLGIGVAHAKSIQSYNDGGYIVHAGESPAMLVTEGFQQSNGQWKKVAGLASADCVSFESVYSAGYYLRHYNFELILTKNDNSQVFREDATFCERPGLGEANHTSFEAYNYPGYYIKHSGIRLGLVELDSSSSTQARSDATFSLIDDVVDGQTYYIQNRNSGKCLRTLDSSTADAASIVQYSCGSNDVEQWTLKSVGNHQYNIIQVSSGKFADISGASTSSGGNNIIWRETGSDNQKWEMVDQGDGFFHIVNVHSGLLLDISSGSTADNANSIQWPDNQGANQDWRFIHSSIDHFSTNPILSKVGVDLADPDVIYANDRFYLYPTTVPTRDWLSTNMHVYSSDDFIDWQDDGEIVSNQNFTWEDTKFWAPAIEKRNGKFYFYFSLNHNVAVAVADSPTGPFTDPLGGPLVEGHIDPDVFIDDDGQGYLYYGQGYPRVQLLNDDMISTRGQEIALEAPNMREGIYMFKRNGVYYLSWSVDDARSDNYHVEYSIGQSPLGPFEYQGVLLEKAGELVGTGHHSIIQMPDSDDWYIVYHRHFVPDGGGQYREIATQKLTFNNDGTIQQVVPQHTFRKPVQ